MCWKLFMDVLREKKKEIEREREIPKEEYH